MAEKRKLTDDERETQRASFARRVAPGLWVDRDGNVHVSVPELLEHFGWPDTEANRELVTEVAKRELARQWPAAEIIEQE